MNLKDLVPEIVLASGSPARRELLENLGIKVMVRPQDCLEFTDEKEPGKVVESLSRLKLDSYMKNMDFNPDMPALACDTLLWFESRFIGKAHSPQEARDQIASLSGKTHQVYSGYSLYIKGNIYSGSDYANVTFSTISEMKLNEYISSNQWVGAAGSYHIFGLAVDFIKKTEGDVNTVIGLPLVKLEELLKSAL